MKIEEHVVLSRYTTIGSGGPARTFARPETLAELREALTWARESGLPVASVGLGSNLLVADLQRQRKAAQPTNKRTYGSVFKNPEHELSAGRMLEACGLKGHRVGGAVVSPRHANFIENADGARSADAVALMTEARRRAWEQFGVELIHEVEFLGELELPPFDR